MNELQNLNPIQKPEKQVKISTKDNGRLSEKHLKMGRTKDKVAYYSEKLRCWFFLKPGKDFAETEERYHQNKENRLFNNKKETT